jgi:hypothetical protein
MLFESENVRRGGLWHDASLPLCSLTRKFFRNATG